MIRWDNAVLFGPAVVWGLCTIAGLSASWADASAWGPVDRTAAEAIGSDRCRACHPDQHASWRASFHRTMTQSVADPNAVLAPFAGETLDYLGFRATMSRSVAGRPHVTLARIGSDEPALLDVDVELTVGSHRYQQYVARIDRGGGPEERWRLPIAWHIETRRWIPMGAAFLTPDGTPGESADALRHLDRWSDNCIFCHNTEPAPGLHDDGIVRPRIAELGIACEACHGRASAHVARHESVARRLLSAIDDRPADRSITHPARLDPARASEVCGRCHGQRIGHDIASVLADGDRFTPGDALADVSRPIFRDSAIAGESAGIFAARFWPDGTPRLSAYEYQGLLLSPCHDEGRGMGCGDCHAMHGPDPSMQLRADYDGDAVCGRCHDRATLSASDRDAGHGGHGDAVTCAGCHLPRTTYGLLLGMQSHRITVPAPDALLDRNDVPDACTQCHVDRSRAWAAAAMARLGAGPHDEPFGEPEVSRIALDLVGGDPIQRALATDALAQPTATGSPRIRAAWLVDALYDDYPAVRFMAARALVRIAEDVDLREAAALARAYDPVADPAERLGIAERLRAALGPGVLADDPDRRDLLIDARDDRAIWIGE